MNIIVNIATSCGLVNGCPALMDSLTLDEDATPLEELIAAMGPNDTELELDSPPLAINATPLLPSDEMAVMLAAKLSLEEDRLVIPVPQNTRPKEVTVWSSRAAACGMPDKLKVLDHMSDIAFATTDYKVQSKTLDRLVICLAPRSFPPYFSLTTLHVIASRVKLGMRLRTIGLDVLRGDVSHLTSLQHAPTLGIWNNAYDGDGRWSETLLNLGIHAALGGNAPLEVEDEPDPDDWEPAETMDTS